MHRSTIARSMGLITATLLAISCSESVEPHVSRTVPLPRFSYSASGSSLNRVIGTLNESGTRLGKGFDTGNPHTGDAIVATFVWQSSTTTNIITSVHDNLNDANFTPVGNPYTLVEFVHAGTTSMATYVATGVHGFSDPAPSGGPYLAVFADLSESVTDGGVLLTTYGGIEDAPAQALGAHHSASATGTGSQVVDPGPIAVTNGALVYTASLVPTNGLGGRALPGNFGYITTVSDANMVNDAGYLVASSAGSVDAQWSYTFNAPSAAVATVIALNRANPSNQSPTANFTSSCTALTCNFTSTSTDPDGSIASYSWNFGDGATSTAQNPSHAYTAGGSYTVTLTVTDNGGAASTPASQTVTVTAPNQPPTANFTSSCSGLSCTFTSTSSDPDGSVASYSWTFGDGTSSTAQNPSHSYAAGGTYTVTLIVTDNQGAQSTTSTKSVTVTPPNTAPVVDAGPDQTVVLGVLYTQTVTFSDPDNGPWTYTVDWGDGSTSSGSRATAGSFSLNHTYLGVSVLGTRTIKVTIRDSLGASGSDTKKLTVVLL
jgi:PKD repeat protein